jgi:hypothetical protein
MIASALRTPIDDPIRDVRMQTALGWFRDVWTEGKPVKASEEALIAEKFRTGWVESVAKRIGVAGR